MEDLEFLYKEGKVIDTVIDICSADRNLERFNASNVYTVEIPLVKNVVSIELLEYFFPVCSYLIDTNNCKLLINDVPAEIPIGDYNINELVQIVNETLSVQVEYVSRLHKLRLVSMDVKIVTESASLSRILGIPNRPYNWTRDTELPYRIQLHTSGTFAYIGFENVIKDRHLAKFKILFGDSVNYHRNRENIVKTRGHPIGKLNKLSITIKHPDNSLVATNGIDHWFTLNITHISMDDAKLPMNFPHLLPPQDYKPQGGFYGNLPPTDSDEDDVF
jgi:hypothetical protein